jgi:hypothetical protein
VEVTEKRGAAVSGAAALLALAHRPLPFSRRYFWNEMSGESQYERPANFETAKADIFASARGQAEKEERYKGHKNEGFARYTDPETQMMYVPT